MPLQKRVAAPTPGLAEVGLPMPAPWLHMPWRWE